MRFVFSSAVVFATLLAMIALNSFGLHFGAYTWCHVPLISLIGVVMPTRNGRSRKVLMSLLGLIWCSACLLFVLWTQRELMLILGLTALGAALVVFCGKLFFAVKGELEHIKYS